jgi:hypothetical protein
MSKLIVTLKSRTTGTNTGVEGVYQLPNSSPAKLARKDGTTVFPNRGSLTQAAKRLANTLGWEYEVAELQKKAAKKSVKPVAKQASVAKKSTKPVAKKTVSAPAVSACTKTSSTEKNN